MRGRFGGLGRSVMVCRLGMVNVGIAGKFACDELQVPVGLPT
jgi:hypothetical protein